MLDDSRQPVHEMVVVAGVAILVEVESRVDADGRVVLATVPGEALQLHAEDVGRVTDQLHAVLLALVRALLTPVPLDDLHHILLQVVGQGAVWDFGRDGDRKCTVRVSFGPRFMATLAPNCRCGNQLHE